VVELLSKGQAEVGLILTERMINMPAEVAPPMYKMLHEEITWAIEDNEPYNFTHYLILSKTYCEVQSKLDQEADRPKKKQRADDMQPENFYFHIEDPTLHKHAAAFGDYPLVHEAAEGDADSKRAFQDRGIRPQGHMILIESGNFEKAFQALQEAFAGQAG
jgi:protein BCP1